MSEAVGIAVEKATGRAWEDRVRRAMMRAESKEWPKDREERVMLALQDRRILAAECRRLQAQVAALLHISEHSDGHG